MVKLNKIYTRTGDDGTTGLGTGERVPKTDVRVTAYGEVDEANAAIGLAVNAARDAGTTPTRPGGRSPTSSAGSSTTSSTSAPTSASRSSPTKTPR
jgi:hypothetical protein